jgi:sulfane dehydrogenase subunit SoxC
MADGSARMFMLPDGRALRSSLPSYPVTLTRAGWRSHASPWTGSGKIARVDVSTDGGATWTAAKLQNRCCRKRTRASRHLWNWTGGERGDLEPRRSTKRIHAADARDVDQIATA